MSLLPLPLLPLSLLQLPLSARQPSAQLTGVSVIQAQSKQLELADNSDDWEWVGVRRRCDQSDSVVHNVS